MKNIHSLIRASALLSRFAADTYINGLLSIPSAQLGANTYTNVDLTVTSVVSIGTGAQNRFINNHNSTNGQLTIPSVIVGSTTFSKVFIKIYTVISTGAFYNIVQKHSSAGTSPQVTLGI